MLKEKIKKIQKELENQNLDELIIGNFGFNLYDDLLYYILLMAPEHALFFMPSAGKAALYVASFEVKQMKRKYPELKILPMKHSAEQTIQDYARKRSKIAIRLSNLPSSIYKTITNNNGARWYDFQNSQKIMSVKLAEELKRIKQAARITDKIFSKLISNFRRFKTEKDIADFILTESIKYEAETAFPPIIASGENASDPHYSPQKKKIKKGFCVIDMGVRYKGYCSDMTRTIYLGKPNNEKIQLYNKILKIQTSAIKQIKAGISTSRLDKFCRDELGKKFEKQFIHGLGHGIGSQVHEWPPIGGKTNIELEENMVITIEPGIYKNKQYGIRIEDQIIVTERGGYAINKSNKKFTYIPL